MGDDTPGETVTDERGDSSGGESPTDDSVIEELQPEGPPGPLGTVDALTLETSWAPSNLIPSQVKVLEDNDTVHLLVRARR